MKHETMLQNLSHLQKLFVIQFFIGGFIYATLMWLIDMNGYSGFEFLFNFILFGGLMAFTQIWIEKRTLNKIGISELNAETMDADQQRELQIQMTKEEFYAFWKESSSYNAVEKEDGSLVVNKKYYTSAYKADINVSYQEGAPPRMILKSMPSKWVHNDLALIHRTINAVKEYAENIVSTN